MTSWWRRLLRPGEAGNGEQRWVVIDVEASGLDPNHDRLLAIAGLGLGFERGAPVLQLADSFEVILRQEGSAVETEVDKPNILLHGIGVGAQRGGTPSRDALEAFRLWLAGAPILGYHVAFDQTLIQRYCSSHLGRRLSNQWVDLEHVVRLIVPELPDRSLDAAMAHFGVTCSVRHQAVADALATAEVLLHSWPAARAQMGGRSDFRSLRRLAARYRWLAR